MGAFARVYSDEQRDALAHARAVLRIKPAQRISELAAAGELRSPAGEPLEAFHVPAQTVRDIGRRYEKRRAGLERSATAELAPADALENLRRRLLSAADHELSELERRQALRRPADLERLRQIARAVREAAALPSSAAPAPSSSPEPGRRTRGGLAGQILRAGERGAERISAREPEPEPVHESSSPSESTGERDAHAPALEPESPESTAPAEPAHV